MFKNLFNALSAVGKDKWMHFTFSLLIEVFVFAICSACGLGVWTVAPAFVIAFGAGIIKEIRDSKKGTGFDHYDIVADFLGCFVGVILISLMLI